MKELDLTISKRYQRICIKHRRVDSFYEFTGIFAILALPLLRDSGR